MKKLLFIFLVAAPVLGQSNLNPNTTMKTPIVLSHIQFSSSPSVLPDLFLRRTGASTFCFASSINNCAGATGTIDNLTVAQTFTTNLSTVAQQTITQSLKLSWLANASSKCMSLSATQTVTLEPYPCNTINGISEIVQILPNIGDVPMAVSTTQWQWQTIAKLSSGSPTVNHAVCVKSTGPPVTYGFCSTVVDASGACTCN